MLVATSEARIGPSAMRTTLLLERAVRGTVVLRDQLVFDTRFAASASGKPEPVGHLFLLASGLFVSDRGEQVMAPVAFLLADDEIERLAKAARTFRTDGHQVHVIQLRFARDQLRAPIGMGAGPVPLSATCWDAAAALLAHAPRGDAADLGHLLAALAASGAIVGAVAGTVMTEEPERFRRLWDALRPLYATYGATTSLKQLAASLGMSMRQIGRDAKELSKAFGIAGGYRDALLVLRLRTAALMLSAPGAGVGEVARLVGYGSPIAMARAFRDARLPSPSVVQAALRGE